MKTITCNNCSKDVKLIPTNYYTKELEDLQDIGIRCPHCKTEYHGYYLTPRLIKQQQALLAARDKKQWKQVKRIQRNYEKEYLEIQAKGIEKYGN